MEIKQILNGEVIKITELQEDLVDLTFYKYAPIMSVNMERTLFAYKNLLSNNRRLSNFENPQKTFD